MSENILAVLLENGKNGLHPITKKVVTTAVALSNEKGYKSEGYLFLTELTNDLKIELENTGLDRIIVFESKVYESFIPENIVSSLCKKIKGRADVFLVPATPEGRIVSSMAASKLKTGVTADCTKLEFNENGSLIQTRPAFSGNIMASIKTQTMPQIASLRFGTEIKSNNIKTEIIVENEVEKIVEYKTFWQDKAESEIPKNEDFIIALGGGIKKKEDIKLFEKLAFKLGAELYSSRALVDRGYFKRRNQIGLSGQSVSPKLLITFGVSGSLQFRAGLENAGKIIAVNLDENAPIMRIANTAIVGDMYEIAEEMLK